MTADIAATGVAAGELKQFVERIERLEEEKKALSDDIRDVYAELKGRGLIPKRCGRSSRSGSRIMPSARRWRRFSISTCRR